jgi:expansin
MRLQTFCFSNSTAMKQLLFSLLAGALLLGGTAPALAQRCAPSPTYAERSTYYEPKNDGSLNCAFPAGFAPKIPTVAVSTLRYGTSGANNAQLCGACVEVRGPRGKYVFMVRDRCPDKICNDDPNMLDIEKKYLSKVGDFGTFDGRNLVRWKVVACPLNSSSRLQFALKAGSNQWWTSIQVRNSRYPITKVEYRLSNGSYRRLTRTQDNYFVLDGIGVVNNKAAFRVTDRNGNTVLSSNIVLRAAGSGQRQGPTVRGQRQFPLCTANRAALDDEEAETLSGSPAAAEAAQQELRMWPNPATDAVQFAWEEFNQQPIQLTVLNAQGRVVLQQQVTQLVGYELNTNALPSGLYRVSLQAGSKVTTRQLLVQH